MASELVESVERIIIGALAMQDSFARGYGTEPDSGDVTRRAINALADELDDSEDDALYVNYPYAGEVYVGEVAASWLRTQAEESEE